MFPQDFVNWAREYTALGWRVFPVGVDKRPAIYTYVNPKNGLVEKWKEYATNDFDKFMDIAKAAKRKNDQPLAIGWALDREHVVIDVDDRELFVEYITQNSLYIAETLTQKTLKGTHYIYSSHKPMRTNVKLQFFTKNGERESAGDIKALNGYIVIPSGADARRWVEWPRSLEQVPECWYSAKTVVPEEVSEVVLRQAVKKLDDVAAYSDLEAKIALDILCDKIALTPDGNKRHAVIYHAAYEVRPLIKRHKLDEEYVRTRITEATVRCGKSPQDAKRQMDKAFQAFDDYVNEFFVGRPDLSFEDKLGLLPQLDDTFIK